MLMRLESGAGLATRDPQEDILATLELTPEQLAQHPKQITPDTKAYVGSLVHTDSQGKIIPIFEKLADVEHIYNAKGKAIPTWNLEIGYRSVKEIKRDLEKAGDIDVDLYIIKNIITSREFAQSLLSRRQSVRLVMLDGADLGYPTIATTEQRFDRGQELGAELCHPEVGIYQRLHDRNQEMNTAYWIAMNPIFISVSNQRLFRLSHECYSSSLHISWPGPGGPRRDDDSLRLSVRWAGPGGRWDPEGQWVFSFPQVTSKP